MPRCEARWRSGDTALPATGHESGPQPTAAVRTVAHMRTLVSRLCLCLLLGPAPAAAAASLLLPGEHPAEAVARLDGDGWFAVLAGPSGDRLDAVGLRFETSPLPAGAGARALRIDLGGDTPDVRFLVRGAGFTAGPLVTVVDVPRQIPQDLPLLMFLDTAEPHRLDFDCAPAPAETLDCALVYRHAGRRQELARCVARPGPGGRPDFADAAAPAVLWTGDVDRDGRLDLLLDRGEACAQTVPTLLLSTARRGEELVGVHARETGTLALH